MGGSGSINAMVYLRGSEADFRAWEVPGWGWSDVVPVYEQLERVLDVRPREPTEFTEACIHSAEEAGFHRERDLDNGALLGALGYEAMGEFGIAGRRYFRKTSPDGVRTHQVHGFGIDSPELQRHLDFRDYLRAHAEDAKAYDRLKRELAVRCASNVEAYTDAKTDFIRDIERRAADWRRAVTVSAVTVESRR